MSDKTELIEALGESQLFSLKQSIDEKTDAMGKLLHDVYYDDIWEKWGYASFLEFIEKLGLSIRRAQWLIKNARDEMRS